MGYVVSYNPDSDRHDVLTLKPFKLIKSFAYERDAFDFAKQLTAIKNNKNN